jgi:ParB family chromosome partitioning protein
VVENIQRRDLNIIEEAEGYNQLIAEFNLTQQEVAERVGKSRPGVANALRLLELPDEVKQLLSQNVISPGHAKVLLGVEDQKERIILARSIVDEGLSVRALEQKIEKRNKPVAEKRTGRPDLPESYVRDLADKLHTYLGCAVRLYPGVTHPNGRHTKGVLEIDFFDNDDLDRIISVIGLKVD